MITVFKADCPLKTPVGRVLPAGQTSFTGIGRSLLSEALDSFRIKDRELIFPYFNGISQGLDDRPLNPSGITDFLVTMRYLRGRAESLPSRATGLRRTVPDPEKWSLWLRGGEQSPAGGNFFVRGDKVLHLSRLAPRFAVFGFGVFCGAMIYCWVDADPPNLVVEVEEEKGPRAADLEGMFKSVLERNGRAIDLIRVSWERRSAVLSATGWRGDSSFSTPGLGPAISIIGLTTAGFGPGSSDARPSAVEASRHAVPVVMVVQQGDKFYSARFVAAPGSDSSSRVWQSLNADSRTREVIREFTG